VESCPVEITWLFQILKLQVEKANKIIGESSFYQQVGEKKLQQLKNVRPSGISAVMVDRTVAPLLIGMEMS
jgi:hypothetical protein